MSFWKCDDGTTETSIEYFDTNEVGSNSDKITHEFELTSTISFTLDDCGRLYALCKDNTDGSETSIMITRNAGYLRKLISWLIKTYKQLDLKTKH